VEQAHRISDIGEASIRLGHRSEGVYITEARDGMGLIYPRGLPVKGLVKKASGLAADYGPLAPLPPTRGSMTW
jgi:hypothetical protein